MPFLGTQPAETALTTGDLADDIVTEAKMANDAIGLAELKAGTDGEIISWDASGNPVAIGAGTAGHFLKSQGAGSQPVFAAAGGKVAQFVFSQSVTGTSRSHSSLTFVDTGKSVSITPTASNSKILVEFTGNIVVNADPGAAMFKIYRDSTDLTPSGGSAHFGGHYHGGTSTNQGGSNFLVRHVDDSPGTSTYEYKLYWESYYGAGTIYLGQDSGNSEQYPTLATATEFTA
jgi:hypothetical protein